MRQLVLLELRQQMLRQFILLHRAADHLLEPPVNAGIVSGGKPALRGRPTAAQTFAEDDFLFGLFENRLGGFRGGLGDGLRGRFGGLGVGFHRGLGGFGGGFGSFNQASAASLQQGGTLSAPKDLFSPTMTGFGDKDPKDFTIDRRPTLFGGKDPKDYTLEETRYAQAVSIAQNPTTGTGRSPFGGKDPKDYTPEEARIAEQTRFAPKDFTPEVARVNRAQDHGTGAPIGYARGGGIAALSGGGSLGSYSDGGQLLKGPGDGLSDHIPAVIGKKQPARLADGEFVVSADVVSALGGGSTEAGARKLYSMMDRIRKSAHGTKKQVKAVAEKKVLPA